MAKPLAFRPNGFLLLAVAFWGLNFVAVKEVFAEIDPPAAALLRFLVMWAGLVLVCLWKGESLRLPREDALRFLYLGFMSMGIYMVAFFEGMRGSGATEGAILFQLSPVFTAILAASFGLERFSKGSFAGAMVAFAGAAMIVYSPSPADHNRALSNLIVIGAALLWAYSVTLMRSLLVRYSPLRVLTLSMPGALPVMLVYGLMPAARQPWHAVSPYAWLKFAQVSLMSGIVAFLCFYRGIRDVGASGATLYQFLTPVGATIFAMAIERSIPTTFQVLGLTVVLAGVGFASRARLVAEVQPAEA